MKAIAAIMLMTAVVCAAGCKTKPLWTSSPKWFSLCSIFLCIIILSVKLSVFRQYTLLGMRFFLKFTKLTASNKPDYAPLFTNKYSLLSFLQLHMEHVGVVGVVEHFGGVERATFAVLLK